MESKEGNAWFYIHNHQQQGPVGLFELKKLFEQGILHAETFIWSKEMNCWQMAKSLDLFPDSTLNPILTVQQTENLAGNWHELEKDTYPKGRPFVRYLARFFDLSLFSLFLITFVSIFSPKFILESSDIFIFILSLVLYILVEASILSIFGNTLGKSILNARLRTTNGDPLNFLTSFKRSIFVTAAGMGFGLPIINIICFYFSYYDLKKNGKSTWDQQIGTVVLYGKVSTSRILFVSLFPIALLIAGLTI
ncbi:RDD family protein [Neobacillus sp. WH10]|uniref:RDD family protein n=1 Tax=Neobacillus sp. WH10 TaxID=3047873 RepID=UPI0024C1EB95|nr:RDD family protein [Neobacillus sp. WH10]WHY78591.1 RDD family protein [Neobacillus sp. WH10]